MTSFTVNGNPVKYQLPADTPLLWALRDASNLTGTKFGCGAGLCGACTVHVDGVPTRSCQVTIGDIEGTLVTTIEGLSEDRSHVVQQAWLAEQVPQCGYCQSGMIMATVALLKTTPEPTREQIREQITNLCRCGTYPRIEKAILRAAAAMKAGEAISVVPGPETTVEEAARRVPSLQSS
ncbi:(2Fe-2S)-binding protein [Sandaracinobacteroides saxicola]|uniref:(2Fe-2S)-binding protein n=1 Tax=Sandaracinobacteroides saxicola TaxID=2759707 RepID=A0A7G5IH00_9SPHN|nr:(2Fe-2S)-binding protein [Sandaracinobacteroides saxicola]QMW22642.1 (2Fe-2S)-binding protein [Sandaracinobacteroides saxicola]